MNKTYELNYDNLLVIYEIECDVDDNHVIVNSIIDQNNNPITADVETMADIKFNALCEYSNLQHETYMRTGEII